MDIANIIAEITKIQEAEVTPASTTSKLKTGLSNLAHGFSEMRLSEVRLSDVQEKAVSLVSNRLFTPNAVQLLHLSQSNRTEQLIRTHFLAFWTGKPKPNITDIFIVLQNSPDAQRHLADHKTYELQVAKRVPNPTTHGYHGTQRACKVGDDARETNPCFKPDCHLCSILRGSFDLDRVGSVNNFGKGFYSSTDPSKANNYTSNVDKSDAHRTLMMCTVVVGKKEVLYSRDLKRTGPSAGFDSVEADKKVTGHVETIVYKEAAILPHALVVYTDTPTSSVVRPSPTVTTGNIYTIVNSQFAQSLDLNVYDHRIVGFGLHGRDNQLWIFEEDSGAFVIRNKARNDLYIGFKVYGARLNGAELAGVDYYSRALWDVEPAMNGTVLIALHNSKGRCMDLDKRSGASDGTHVTLWDHLQNAEQQRWTLDFVAKSTTPRHVST